MIGSPSALARPRPRHLVSSANLSQAQAPPAARLWPVSDIVVEAESMEAPGPARPSAVVPSLAPPPPVRQLAQAPRHPPPAVPRTPQAVPEPVAAQPPVPQAVRAQIPASADRPSAAPASSASPPPAHECPSDRKSTRLKSSHFGISYA